jgi:hypothetical protein
METLAGNKIFSFSFLLLFFFHEEMELLFKSPILFLLGKFANLLFGFILASWFNQIDIKIPIKCFGQ